MKKVIAVLAMALVTTGCDREAGFRLDKGTLGGATSQNTDAMTGKYVMHMARRFAEEVPNTVNFEFDSYILDGEAQTVLRQQADWIKQFPEVRFRVYGFTDLVGTAGYNKRLGQKRANAVVAFLTSQGISRSRLEAVVSYGETRPVIATPNRERQNRRAVTEVNAFVERNPTVLEGKYAQIIYRDYIASAVPPTQLTGIEASTTSLSD